MLLLPVAWVFSFSFGVFLLRMQRLVLRPGHQSRQGQVEEVAEPQPPEPPKEVCLGSGWEFEAGSKMFKHLFHGIAR